MEQNIAITLVTGILLALAHGTNASLLWVNIASIGSVTVETNVTACSYLSGFVLEQQRVCKAKPRVVPSIQKGVRVAMRECKRQLSKERWDCSTMTELSALKGLLAIPSKETAFVYALTSAAVAHAVTKSCAAGSLADCSCQLKSNYLTRTNSRLESWERRGKCDENVEYGLLFSQLFVDAPDQAKQARIKFRRSGQNFVNLHNSNAGRKAILSSVKTRCRCHGSSQACVVRTCWNVLPKFSAIGNLLKKKYQTAVEVKYARRKRKLKKKHARKQALDPQDLVYMKPSPNYCRSNPRIGIDGTSGRSCEKNTRNSMNSCSLLCCGQGYDTRIVREKKLCKCRFIWCCHVKCQTCESISEVYTCK